MTNPTRIALLGLALLAPLTLGACRYTFLPLIPGEVQADVPARLENATLTRQGEELVLSGSLMREDRTGFLTAVWFREDTELARDSVYLDQNERAFTLRLNAPEPGDYRVIVSFDGVALRQFEQMETPGP